MAIYRLFSKNGISVEITGKDFHVPNIYGTLDMFLNDISQDTIDKDMYDEKPEMLGDIEKMSFSYIRVIPHVYNCNNNTFRIVSN